MVSISSRRDDFTAIDPIRDVKYLAERILKEEAKAAKAGEQRKGKKGMNPELIAKLLPPDMREPIHGRKSMRVFLTHKIMKGFVDAYVETPQQSWEELCRVRRYLMMHVLYSGLKDERMDLAPVTLASAGVPEMMLDFIKRGNDREFILLPKYRSYPVVFLAAEILSYFMHRQCSVYPVFCEKFFREMPGAPQEISRMMDVQSWYESLAAVRLFGFGATHPAGCLWLLHHRSTFTKLLQFTYGAGEVIERHIQREKMQNVEDYLKVLCQVHVQKENYVKTTRIMGTYASCMAVLVFTNMMHHFGANYEEFRILRRAVYDAEVLQNFYNIARQLIRWLTPARFMSGFLQGIFRCLEMDRAMKYLFLENFEFFRKHKVSAGWDSLHHWNHQTLRPSHIAFLVCHALTVKNLIGANWAAAILANTLDHGPDEVAKLIIETCGNELFDLSHLVELKDSVKMSLQNSLLEAMLRHAGFSHKHWSEDDRYIGEVLPAKEIPECCLEAALYCRRAHLEGEMTLAEKQYRVKLGDAKKDLGNASFKKGRFKDAIVLYTEALAICPLSARTRQGLYYSNRAECYLRLNDPQRALHDCNRSLCLDQTMFVKVQWRRSRAYQRMDLDYPAWLDMYCIREDWKGTKVDSTGVDFNQLEDAFREKICLVEKDDMIDLERSAVDTL